MRAAKKFRVKPNRTCPVCGVRFYAEPNRIAKSTDGIVYCSNQCSHKTGKLGRKKRARMLLCKSCGNEFEVKNHRFFDGSHPQFCSHKCEAAMKHQESVERNTRICAHCGREFHRDITSIRKTEKITGGKVYCSSACSYAANGGRGMNQLERDFQAVFPELQYVGDGKSRLPDGIQGLIPDFLVPESKKIIELFGNYWHAGEDPQLRIRKIRAFGYEAIVVWESDFRKCPEETIARIRQFISENGIN